MPCWSRRDHVFAGTLGKGFMCTNGNRNAGLRSSKGCPPSNVTALALREWISLRRHGQRPGANSGTEAASMKKTHAQRCFALLFAPALLLADAGILIPRDKAQPDPAILSLEEMEITIRIDNGDARVFVRQIFANHTERNRRRELHFRPAQPGHGFGFRGVGWADPHSGRGAGTQARGRDLHPAQTAGNRSRHCCRWENAGRKKPSAARSSAPASFPFQAHGTKRLEIEYHQSIPVENLKSYFAIPLRPDAYSVAGGAASPHQFRTALGARDHELSGAPRKRFPLQLDETTPHAGDAGTSKAKT